MSVTIELQSLTHSRQSCFKACRRKAWFSYEQAIRPTEDARALRMGTQWHNCLELLGKGESIDTAYASLQTAYINLGAFAPDYERSQEMAYECETIGRLLYAYVWRWDGQEPEWIACEQSFTIPLVNPATGKPSKTFQLAGKIDGIVKLADGRLAVMEHKLLSDDLSSDSNLWRYLNIDSQITVYMLAARALGFAVDTVLYNVTRKPTIKPTAIPEVDDDGKKIVLNAACERVRNAPKKAKKSCDNCRGQGFFGPDNADCPCTYGKWRQTASTADGYVLATRDMTTDEWGEKLTADIGERPEYYFARQEIPRLDCDMEQYQRELWDIARAYREAQRSDSWYRTAHKDSCSYCAFFGLCTSGFTPTDSLPEGFVRVDDIHPELS